MPLPVSFKAITKFMQASQDHYLNVLFFYSKKFVSNIFFKFSAFLLDDVRHFCFWKKRHERVTDGWVSRIGKKSGGNEIGFFIRAWSGFQPKSNCCFFNRTSCINRAKNRSGVNKMLTEFEGRTISEIWSFGNKDKRLWKERKLTIRWR